MAKKTGYILGAGYTLAAGRVYQVQNFTLQWQISWKKFPITLSENGLGLLGIGSIFKNKFPICESCKALKKLAAKKIRT